jgi:hypothetical protein
MGRKQDFSQSTIYHIRVIETKMVAYVGSTTNFRQRCATHKSNCKIGLTLPIYKYIRDNGGFVLFEIIPVAFLHLNDVIELRIEEQKEMDKYTDKLNAIKAYISKENRTKYVKEYNKEYNDRNKDSLIKQQKEYRNQNKDKMAEYQKEYREQNKGHNKYKTKEYYEKNKTKMNEQSKAYREQNQEKLKEYAIKYREQNQEKLKEYKKEYYQQNKIKIQEQ